MEFMCKAPEDKFKIDHCKMDHGDVIEEYPQLLYHLLGTMQREKRQSSFSRSTIRQVELITRHVLLGGVLNAEFLREWSTMPGILCVAGIARDASLPSKTIKYSETIINFMLMLVGQVTYLNEEIDARDAVESALDPFKYNPDSLVRSPRGIKSVPAFRKKHGFSVNVSYGLEHFG